MVGQLVQPVVIGLDSTGYPICNYVPVLTGAILIKHTNSQRTVHNIVLGDGIVKWGGTCEKELRWK